ncbi:hypothetical protein [Thioalbus denitrificans]|uniref:hypothetical protein n=1 Tax=Thioalbus denitrificans TaxID=547122 RepID=UPI0011C03725|nr:hypothetical protein [Thioalbus denitrificans]
MYTGSLWLDFESEDEEAHYVANVSRCIIRDNELILEFSGSDEGHHFIGNCTLSKSGAGYSGKGSFEYAGNSEVSSSVAVSIEESGSEILLHGTWRDEGETVPYELEAELSKSKRGR